MIFAATSGVKRVLRGVGQAYSPKCVEGKFCELRPNGVLRSSSTLRLPQEAGWIVGVPPVLYYLAMGHAEHVDRPHLHPLAGGSDPLKLAAMRATHGDAGSYPVPFSHYVLDGDAEVWEALSGLREGLLEGVDELGRRVVWT